MMVLTKQICYDALLMTEAQIIPNALLRIYDIEESIPVTEGWSMDRKFKLISKDGTEYLLRITPDGDIDAKQKVFEGLATLASRGFATPVPFETGLCENSNDVYMLLSWVPGKPLEPIVAGINPERVTALGTEAGKIHRAIHAYVPEGLNTDWFGTYAKKIDRVIPWYENCGITLPFGGKVIDFVRQHRGILKNRPVGWQHGDYHIGNFLVTPDDRLGVIDFNRSSFGDPWEEYDRFVFTWSKSPLFAKAQLLAYFDGDVPGEFFTSLALYNAVLILTSIPWAIPFGEKDVQVMIENSHLIFESWDGFEAETPIWFNETEASYL